MVVSSMFSRLKLAIRLAINMVNNKRKRLALSGICAIVFVGAMAQNESRYGRFTGSLESGLGFYTDDPKLSERENKENFGTNTFVNLGYEYKGFRAGIQYDIYEPAMIGYSSEWDGNKVMQGFASYEANKWSLTAGSFYEQFGSGLLFRSYEDRTLGVNTAMMGGLLRIRPWNWLSFKAFAGMPRKFMHYAHTGVYGADVEIGLLDLIVPSSEWGLTIGGSWVLRDDHTDLAYPVQASRQVNGYSARMQLSKGAFTVGGEYTSKGENFMVYDRKAHRGQAVLLNTSVDFSGFGIAAEYRSIQNMEFAMDDDVATGESLNLNYLPSLTRQHKYTLMALYPHEVCKGGETGGQVDLFGEIPFSGSRYPLKFSINGSFYKTLAKTADGTDTKLMSLSGDLDFAEAGIELEKKWSRDLKTTVGVDWQQTQEFSRLGYGDMKMNSEIVVADILYKFGRKHSLRAEVQHAWSDSKDDQRWIMGLAEWGFAPSLMLFVSDMYNYRSNGDRIHYYSVGGSYVWKNLRVACSYGRNRAGMQCSGGVCRYVPEYSGAMVNVSFNY